MLLVSYCLILLTGAFISDNLMRERLGLCTIVITGVNFLINAVPILMSAYSYLRVKTKLCIKKRANYREKQKMLSELRSRTSAERDYAESVDVRADLAAKNFKRFAKYERRFKSGRLTNQDVALNTQKWLNKERELDSDFEPSESPKQPVEIKGEHIFSNLAADEPIERIDSTRSNALQNFAL